MATKYDKLSYRSSWALVVLSPIIVVHYLIKGGWQGETLGFYGILFAMGARTIWDTYKERKAQKAAGHAPA